MKFYITISRSIIRFIIFYLIILFFSQGCAPATRVTVFQHHPPKPDNYPIIIYRTKLPECPYDEIGIVSSRQRNKLITMEQVIESIKQKARQMGGDAVIGLSEVNESQGAVVSNNGFVLDRDPVLSGTVIKFKDLDCRE